MGHNIYKIEFNRIYKAYLDKAERKGRTIAEVNEIISWLTGYTTEQINQKLIDMTSLEDFLCDSPFPNPSRVLITGSICGVKIKEINEPVMKEIRYLDKLIDELAKGKAMEKILRK